jgi:phenylpyruvate tautomerase PptA (4-oxalocrotonate tautomerase family)
MPHAVVHRLSGASPVGRRAIIEAVNRALIGALKLPEDTHPVRLCEYDADAFLIPRQSSSAFTLIEATVYPGRTIETKRRLYTRLINELGKTGIAAEDIRIVLYEVSRENWGLKGGIPASEIDLGFEVEI